MRPRVAVKLETMYGHPKADQGSEKQLCPGWDESISSSLDVGYLEEERNSASSLHSDFHGWPRRLIEVGDRI
jgi:hypothetical protein